jgi:hypothetical protein
MSANQMLLDDAFEDLWRAGPIPDAVRINDRDRTLSANLQAIGLGAIYATRTGQAQFSQAFLEIIPRLEACVFRRAIWLGLVTAQEYMPANIGNSQALYHRRLVLLRPRSLLGQFY